MQYKDIESFLQDKISEYNRNFKEKEKEFSLLKKRLANTGYRPSANYVLSLISDRKTNNEVFVDSYDYDPTDLKLTSSELLWRMKTTDFSDVFDNALALANIGTMLPENIGSIIENIEKDKDELDEEIKNAEKDNKCLNIVIAKQYKTLEEVATDNDKITYFDKKFDDTMYGMLDDYQKDQIAMAPEEFYEFLVQKLISKNKISTKDAPRLAETLINGMKRVVDGDFAMMYDNAEDKIVYFKRSNNRWATDKTIDEKTVTANQNLLCEFQKDCIEVDKKYKALCETQDLNKKHITENALKEIVGQFDKKYELSKDKLKELLTKNLDYNLSIIDKLHQIHHTNTYKYNAQQYKIGAEAGDFDRDIVISPYSKLRDLILGQSNMCKRQQDIVKFAVRFTREANDAEIASDEHGRYWRYCLKTNVKLLPNFLYSLAACWIEDNDNYLRRMDEIIKQSGKLSDDGDSWVDEHSGYIICPRDFDVDEGYEQGYKAKTREVMEQDAGDALLNSSLKPVVKKYTTPETKMMSNVISALAENMGINIDDQKDFMIKIASDTISAGALISEEDHKKRVEEEAKKGKKLPSYIAIYNSTILYLTLGAFLFGVQTSIPSIKTRKTFPGCVRSFTGYPFEGSGDLSSLKYLSCIAYKIRNATSQPWSALMGLKETTVADKIKAFIDNYYLSNVDVMQKCKDKLEYMLANPDESNIPTDHELGKWIQFLPPLVPFKLRPITNISEEFKKQCLHDFKNGATCQREKILVIKSKIIFFSLAIQEQIQKVVTKRSMLLKNSANEPFLENACCSEKGNMSTIKYFAEEEPEIIVYNNIIRDLSHIIEDIIAIAKAPMFFCRENSKNVYAPLSDQYSDDTIYRAFIVFCKFNSIVPISQELDAICGGKPEHFSNIDSISEKIRKLKQEGKNYNNTSLLRLLQYVNRKNIVNINVDTPVITQVQRLRNIIEEMTKDDETVVPAALIQNLEEALDTFDIAVNEDTEEMRKLKNYLGRVNKEMKTEVIDFIGKNAGLTRKNASDIKVYLNTLMEWGASSEEAMKNSISDEATYNSIEFVKNYIHKILNVFPNIIKNKVDYQNSIQIPAYWGLSKNHANDVRNIINEYYKNLRPFYGDKVLSKILATIPKTTKNLLQLALSTPYMSDIYYKGSKTYSVFDKRTCDMLFENYFLQVLLEFKKLSEDQNMLVREMSEDESDTFTVEDLEETALHLSAKPVATILLGNIKDMRTRTAKMLAAFLTIMSNHKDIVDLSYDKVMEVVFKSKEREKDTFTDRLKAMTDEERDADTILKINKLGAWSKGLQKGLTTYVKETYDEERESMEKIADIEKTLRKNKNVVDENMEQYLEDYMENADAVADIEREENDIGWFNGDDAGEDYFGAEQGQDDWEEHD
jgi:hypothetical protein